MNLLNILSVIIIVAVLGALAIFLQKDMDKLKRKYKENARQLLAEPNPDLKAMGEAVKRLRLSLRQGRDEEARQLIKQLREKLGPDPND